MTPQTQLIISKPFEGKDIRAIEYNGDVWLPIVDIAEAWGMDRSTPTKIIARNQEIFIGLSSVVDITSANKLPSDTIGNMVRCVNEEGVYVLALKVSAGRLKNKEVKKKIIRFQKWVPTLIKEFFKGNMIHRDQVQTQLLPAQTPAETLREQFEVAKVIVKETGLKKELADLYALTLTKEMTGLDLDRYIAAIKPQTQQPLSLTAAIPDDKADYERHFPLTKVAEFLNKPDSEIRNLLEQTFKLIYFQNKIWHLTKEGEKFARVFWVTPGAPYNMTQRPFIRYNDLLVKMLRDYYKLPQKRESEV